MAANAEPQKEPSSLADQAGGSYGGFDTATSSSAPPDTSSDGGPPPGAASHRNPNVSMGDGATLNVPQVLAPQESLHLSESVYDPDRSHGDRKTQPKIGSESSIHPVVDDVNDPLNEIEWKEFAKHFDELEELGAGGMGRVLKARQLGALQRIVAVKRIKGLSTDERAVRRFIAEAKALGGLNHPHLVTLHHLWRDDHGPYFVMEFVDGESLAGRLKRGPFQVWREAVEFLCPICDVVQFVHNENIIHRDIKPGNILISRRHNVVKLTDFGIAMVEDGVEWRVTTESGVGLGTPDYMPPEQRTRAKSVDHRADLYSLAATLYHMVTGSPPAGLFKAERLPVEIREHVSRALEGDPEDRHATVEEFRQGLQRCLTPQVHVGGLADAGEDELKDGQCPKCRQMNPLTRTKCRKCGQELVEPCPACQKPTHPWDNFCDCGANIPAEWERLEGSINAKSEQFQTLAAEHHYPAASLLLDEIASLTGQRWAEWREWAAESRTWLETERAERIRWRDDLIAAAQLDFEEARFEQAISRLEQIPTSLFTQVSSQLLEAARKQVERLREMLDDIRTLIDLKDYKRLRKQVDAFLAISPNDRRVLPLDQQLRNRDITRGKRFARDMYHELQESLLKLDVLPTSGEEFPYIVSAAVAGDTVAGILVWVFDIYPAIASNDASHDAEGKTYRAQTLLEIAKRAVDDAIAANDSWAMKFAADVMLQDHARAMDLYQCAAAIGNPCALTAHACLLLDPFLREGLARYSRSPFLSPQISRIATTSEPDIASALQMLRSAHEQGHTVAGRLLEFVNQELRKRAENAPLLDTASSGSAYVDKDSPYSHTLFEDSDGFDIDNVLGSTKDTGGDFLFDASDSDFDDDPRTPPPPSTLGSRGRTYLPPEHAAAALGISVNELMRLRETGKLRGFADRDTWKFKVDDVLEFDLQQSLRELGDPTRQVQTSDERQLRNASPRPLKAPFSAEQARAGQQAWAKFLGKPVVEQNSIGLELTLIPPGEFLMGSPDSEAERLTIETQHTVRLTQPFRLGTYPVLQREFQQVLGRNPSHFSPSGGGKVKVERVDFLRLPVEGVSWFDAVEFCNQLSEREQLSPYYVLSNVLRDGAAIKSADVKVSGGNGYRLPTEAEWEYACRAGTTSPFHFGNVNNGTEANVGGNFPYGTTTKGPYLQRTSVVGSYSANVFGLYDIHGNVWEWCGDSYDASFHGQTSGTAVDPFNVMPAGFRVFRGGSWGEDARDTRSASRVRNSPDSRGRDIGLRIARTE